MCAGEAGEQARAMGADGRVYLGGSREGQRRSPMPRQRNAGMRKAYRSGERWRIKKNEHRAD
ncbi:hypothetical protein XBP1_2550016 [Xenorhabdus bovienii str. puntauvense]|uniref:Uncharacterized protein n=1 Tax=Xenorhabdus bovienii str. puntauvense TaxID=1398201 RepID=A0A077NER5_XENBV|nr:hypothetical protein XBP1_2550016 [Xenorhabdus bovienii str. puntauvense]